MPKILVIEDEAVLLDEILTVLGFEGFDAVGAPNGRLGVERAQEFQPDLILCDIMMPELDGYNVLQLLRSAPLTATVPIIFTTAKSTHSDVRLGMELGADDYLTKPFTNRELVSAIRARLERHEAVVREQNRLLEETQRKVAHMVVQELRLPVVSMNMVQEIIARRMGQFSRGELEDLLATLSAGSQRLYHLVEQMVFITRLETKTLSSETIRKNGMPLQTWPILLAAVDLARRFVSRQRDVVTRLDERDRDAMVWGDGGALKHALAEVIANALTFSPEDNLVLISQWRAEGSVWITVFDQGPGIAPENLTALERFQPLDRETPEQRGMGMPLAKEIVEVHGGAFELVSVPGKGTQVTISLPCMSGGSPE